MKKRKMIYIIFFVIFIMVLFYELYLYFFIYLAEEEERNLIRHLENIPVTTEKTDIEKNIFHHTDVTSDSQSKIKIEANTSQDNTKSDTRSGTESDSTKVKWKGDVILHIPDIQLEKIVYTGSDREQHLANYELITANADMRYENGGNYIICGHASRLYGHSLNRIKEVKEGSKIQIKTSDNNMEEYLVKSVIFQNKDQINNYCNQTTERCLTIISCAKYVSKDSYIIIQAILA